MMTSELIFPAQENVHLGPTLFDPLRDFLDRSGKNVRPRLVELGLRLSLAREEEAAVVGLKDKLKLAGAIVESIHAGSLIIDDIQDGSLVRRNAPALHCQVGMPQALNAGNWLYFRALEQIRHLELSPDRYQSLLQDSFDLLGQAHYGQALDVGVRIDVLPQQEVKELSLTAMRYKTGTLFALAMRFGASLGDELNPRLLQAAFELGTALQIWDDVGNFLRPGGSKYLEDLKLRRPGFVWASVSELRAPEWQRFVEAARELPDETKLKSFTEEQNLRARLLLEAKQRLATAVHYFEEHWNETHPHTLNHIRDLARELETAYV